MQGGMDAVICARFAPLTEAAAKGLLDHWADTPRGEGSALLIALDQFPRSLWRDTPSAFAQDIKAARLALETIETGVIDSYAPWEMAFFPRRDQPLRRPRPPRPVRRDRRADRQDGAAHARASRRHDGRLPAADRPRARNHRTLRPPPAPKPDSRPGSRAPTRKPTSPTGNFPHVRQVETEVGAGP